MKTRYLTRRQVIAATSAGAMGAMINWPLSPLTFVSRDRQKLAINSIHSDI